MNFSIHWYLKKRCWKVADIRKKTNQKMVPNSLDYELILCVRSSYVKSGNLLDWKRLK